MLGLGKTGRDEQFSIIEKEITIAKTGNKNLWEDVFISKFLICLCVM